MISLSLATFPMDCKYLMEEMVKASIDKNMKSVCFTDHIDYEVGKIKSI